MNVRVYRLDDEHKKGMKALFALLMVTSLSAVAASVFPITLVFGQNNTFTGATGQLQQQMQQQGAASPPTPPLQQEQPQLQPQNQGVSVSIVSGASSLTETAFSPNPVEVSVGAPVTWVNDDSQPHTVTSGENATPDGRFDSGIMAPEADFEHTFTETGDYRYFCLLHPNMVGAVTVTVGSSSQSTAIDNTTAITTNSSAALDVITNPLQGLFGGGDQTVGGGAGGTSTGSSTSSSSPPSSGSSRCPDGYHRSPSGDCERATDTRGMPRCPNGYHRSPDGDCEYVG